MVLREDNPPATIADADEISWLDVSDSDNDKNTTATLFGAYVDARTGIITNKSIRDFSNAVFADGQHIEVRNTSGSGMVKGEVVFISGYNAGQDLPEVDLADASTPATMQALALIAETTLANNANGEACISGRMDALDTSAFTAGDDLYVSETPGEFTNVKPTGEALIQKIAIVLRSHASLGVIEILGAGRENDVPNTIPAANIKDIKWKEPVRVASVGNLTLSGEQTIDGILTSTDRILVKNQTSGAENGIYVTAAGAWTRSLDWDTTGEAEGAVVLSREGVLNAGKAFQVADTGTIIIGTTVIGFVVFTDGLTTINFVIDGGGSVITTGKKGTIAIDFDAVVLEWAIIADVSGSIVVDVNKSTFAGYPTTASIAGTELPTISASTKGEDRLVTTWDDIVAGEILEFEVDSAATVTKVTVALKVRKSA